MGQLALLSGRWEWRELRHNWKSLIGLEWNWTHCGLVMPYGDRDWGQHWPDGTKPLPEPNVDWSSVKSSDIHIREISQEMPQPSITKICLKITCLKFHANHPGSSELSYRWRVHTVGSITLIYMFQKKITRIQASYMYMFVFEWKCIKTF